MRIHYNKKDEILFIQFNDRPIERDISYGWNMNVGLTEAGIGQITILDVGVDGLLPLELDEGMYGIIYQKQTTTRPYMPDIMNHKE